MSDAPQLRLAEPLAALSLETDLAMGHPPEEAIRACLLATELARALQLSEAQVSDAYWTSLLSHVGCTAFAHEQAALFGGDEILVNDLGSRADFSDPRDALRFMFAIGRGRSLPRHLGIVFNAVVHGQRFDEQVSVAICEVGATMARRLGLSAGVQRAFLQLFERWDGGGRPRGLRGEDVDLSARLSQFAHQTTVILRLGGVGAAVATARRRSGGAFDPKLVEVFAAKAQELVDAVEREDPWSAVLTVEPEPHATIDDAGMDEIARAFGDVVDLKTPFLAGHSPGVAKLAEGAARSSGAGERDVVAVRRAALLHDIGRAAVPNGIWEKAGPLTRGEWEQVRLHPYHSERILARSAVLGGFATLAGMHHERLDGSGYFRQSDRAALPFLARVLAAADAYQGMTEARPHRAAFSGDAAAEALREEARAGRLDPDAVAAVLGCAGHARPSTPARAHPGGLTDREVEVLRLVARGLSNRELASRLFISPKTAGTHVEHIYMKIGVSSRAAATLFAVEHGLLS